MIGEDLPQEADAAALTGALRDVGVLREGRVVEARLESERKTILSSILRLRLVYDQPSPAAPQTVILKTGLPRTMDRGWNGGRQEVAFYTEIAPALADGVVPGYFGGHWDNETGAWHLLLEDLTDSHVIASEWPLPPTRLQCETILAAHARLHATWWDAPGLGVSIGTWPNSETNKQNRLRLESSYKAFADRLGDLLPPARRDLYETFLGALPRLSERYRTHRHMTIVQGDSHVWNCFLPRDGGDDVRLFDWDWWRPHVAAMDLAYMMALHWYPDRRSRLERPLLDHYHSVLLANGVTFYDRHALDDDYRWSVLMQIVVPPMQAAIGVPPVVWWSHLERIMLAVDDLDCRALLA